MAIIHKIIVLAIFFTVFFIGFSKAQVVPKYISETNNYIAFVDSISNPENQFKLNKVDTTKQISTGIAEGPIFIPKTTLKGGFSIYTTSNDKNGILLKINYNDNLQMYLVKNYYYKHNKLVFSKLELQDWSKGTPTNVYLSREYYSNDSLVFKETPINLIKKRDRWRVFVRLQEEGKDYLSNYLAHLKE